MAHAFFFRAHPDDPTVGPKFKDNREGFVGFVGYGGSVLQWHPELNIGFSYLPTKLSWYDPANRRGASLQKAITDCIKSLKQPM